MVACLSRREEKQHLLQSLGWLIEKKLIFIKVRESGDMAKSPIMSLYHRASSLEGSRVRQIKVSSSSCWRWLPMLT